MYTVKEAAEMLNCSTESIYFKIKILKIKKNKFGRYELSKSTIIKMKKLLVGSGRPKGSKNKCIVV